jgi:Mn-dependent DtxR family transcriptional regulator
MSELLRVQFDLTDLQLQYLEYIIEYSEDHNGNAPGQRQCARQFGVAHTTARGHLEELSNKRLLRLDDGQIIVEDAVWNAPEYIQR